MLMIMRMVIIHHDDDALLIYQKCVIYSCMTSCRAALLKMCLQTDEKVVTKSCENLHVL